MRGSMLDLVLTNKEELVGNVKLKGSLAAVTMKWWSSLSLGQCRCAASSLLRTSGEQTLACSGICLVEYHGIKAWREEGLKKAGK